MPSPLSLSQSLITAMKNGDEETAIELLQNAPLNFLLYRDPETDESLIHIAAKHDCNKMVETLQKMGMHLDSTPQTHRSHTNLTPTNEINALQLFDSMLSDLEAKATETKKSIIHVLNQKLIWAKETLVNQVNSLGLDQASIEFKLVILVLDHILHDLCHALGQCKKSNSDIFENILEAIDSDPNAKKIYIAASNLRYIYREFIKYFQPKNNDIAKACMKNYQAFIAKMENHKLTRSLLNIDHMNFANHAYLAGSLYDTYNHLAKVKISEENATSLIENYVSIFAKFNLQLLSALNKNTNSSTSALNHENELYIYEHISFADANFLKPEQFNLEALQRLSKDLVLTIVPLPSHYQESWVESIYKWRKTFLIQVQNMQWILDRLREAKEKIRCGKKVEDSCYDLLKQVKNIAELENYFLIYILITQT